MRARVARRLAEWVRRILRHPAPAPRTWIGHGGAVSRNLTAAELAEPFTGEPREPGWGERRHDR